MNPSGGTADPPAWSRQQRRPRPPGLFTMLLMAVCLHAAAEGQQRAPKPRLDRIRQVVDTLAKAPTTATGTVGFYLAELESPARPVLERLGGQSFITASTMKVVTTSVALEVLGPEFAFETTVLWQPESADLVIRGAGDPTLGRGGWDPLFETWLDGLRAHGITEVRGRVIADETSWAPQEIPDGWTWLDIGNYYAPPLTPLAFHDNEFRIWFRLAGRPGDQADFYDADPWPDGLQVRDEVVIGAPGTGDQAYAFAAPGDTRFTLRGSLAQDAGKSFIRVALPDPALFCAQQFTRFLQTRSIPVHGRATTSRRLATTGKSLGQQTGSIIALHRSSPLGDMLAPINHQSLNLDCECLLRTLGQGRADQGLQVIRNHLAGRQLPLPGFRQTDGSGLSRTNMITPALLARALASALTGPQGDRFLASLPVLGTPRSTLRQLPPPSRDSVIHAKSGTIERVKAYAGLLQTASGRRYVFSVLVNNYDGDFNQDVAPGLQSLFEALGALP